MPLSSTRRWRFDPGLSRSVGLGPVASPPFSPQTRRCRCRPGPSRSRWPCPGGRAASGAASPTRLPLASHASGARRSCPTRNPSPGAGAPRDGQQAISPSTAWSASARRRRADASAQDEHNPRQTGTVRPARPAAFGLDTLRWQKECNLLPQLIGNQGCNHVRPTTAGPSGSVLIGTLSGRLLNPADYIIIDTLKLIKSQ